MKFVLKKDGKYWDSSRFDRSNRSSMSAALEDVLNWRDKILREEPEAKVTIKVKF